MVQLIRIRVLFYTIIEIENNFHPRFKPFIILNEFPGVCFSPWKLFSNILKVTWPAQIHVLDGVSKMKTSSEYSDEAYIMHIIEIDLVLIRSLYVRQ